MSLPLKTGTLVLSAALLAACQTKEAPSDDRHVSERVTIYTFEKIGGPAAEVSFTDFPPPAPIDDASTPSDPPPLASTSRQQGDIVCPVFFLPRHDRMPPLPVLTPEERRDPDLAAQRLVASLQGLRTYIRTMVTSNEKAYLEYKTACKLN